MPRRPASLRHRCIAMRDLEEKSFLLLLLAVSVAFAWILWPFLGAILWATVLAVVFAPVYRGLLRLVGQRPNVAAFAAVGLILLIVILPLSAIGAAVYREAAAVYDKVQAGELDLGGFLRQVLDDCNRYWSISRPNDISHKTFAAKAIPRKD